MILEIPKLLDEELTRCINKGTIPKEKDKLVLDILLSAIRSNLVKTKNYAKRDQTCSPSELFLMERRIEGLGKLRKDLRLPTPIIS